MERKIKHRTEKTQQRLLCSNNLGFNTLNEKTKENTQKYQNREFKSETR